MKDINEGTHPPAPTNSVNAADSAPTLVIHESTQAENKQQRVKKKRKKFGTNSESNGKVSDDNTLKGQASTARTAMSQMNRELTTMSQANRSQAHRSQTISPQVSSCWKTWNQSKLHVLKKRSTNLVLKKKTKNLLKRRNLLHPSKRRNNRLLKRLQKMKNDLYLRVVVRSYFRSQVWIVVGQAGKLVPVNRKVVTSNFMSSTLIRMFYSDMYNDKNFSIRFLTGSAFIGYLNSNNLYLISKWYFL